MKTDFTEDTGNSFNPIPSLLTLCNAICGFTATLYILSAEAGKVPMISLLLIIAAMVFDVLDGLMARLLKAQSLHGMNLDSIADAVSFGVAPAMMIYQLGSGSASLFGAIHGLSWLAAALYLGSALWRLAHYNALAIQETDSDDHGDFVGLPSPGAAALICSMAVLIPALELSEKTSFLIYIAYAMLSAFLMVSTFPYLHIRRSLTITNKWGRIGAVAVLLLSPIFLKAWALVLWANLYVLCAPLMLIESRLAREAQKNRHAGITPPD